MSSVKQYFDGRAMDYRSQSNSGFWSILRESEKKAIERALNPFSGMACLELGSGSGFYTHLLANSYPSRLVAVDFSYAMLCAMNISGVLKIQSDIQSVSFRISFDRILCAGALEFLPNPNPFFNNIRCLLSQEGLLILLIPSKGLMGKMYKWFHSAHNININLFDRKTLKNLLKKYELKINSIEKPTPMTYVVQISHV